MKRRLVPLLLIFTVTAAMISCSGPEAKKAKYTARAEQYMKESNWPKARVSLQNVLRIDPKDANAYFLFGQVEEKEQNWKNAFGNYLKTVELNPKHREAGIQIARYYLEAGDLERADERADKILADYPADPSGVTIKAAVLSLSGRRKEAVVKAEAAIQDHPASPDLVSLLSSLYFQEGRPDKADMILKRALQESPKNVIFLSNYAELQDRKGDVEGAVTTLQKMIEAEPKNFEQRLRLALYLDRNHQADKAETTLREAVKMEPEAEQRRLVLKDFFKIHHQVQEEEVFLLESGNQVPGSSKIRFALGEFYEEQHDLPKAKKVYQEIIKLNKTPASSEEAEARLAALDLIEGKKEAAEIRLNEILKKNPNSAGALVFKGKIAKGKGDFKEAIQDFRTVLRDQPDRSEIQALLGESYLLSGETGLARESLDKSLVLNPMLKEAKRDLIRIEIAEGHQHEAFLEIDHLLRESPSDQETLGILLDLQMNSKDWAGTEKTLALLRKNGGNPYSLEMAEGGMYQARKDLEKAKTAFEKAVKLHPESPDPLVSLVKIELGQGKKKEARSRLERVISEHSENPFPHELLGEVLLSQKDEGGAEREFLKAIELKSDWIKPWSNRAILKISQKKPDDALKILESGLKLNPGAEELHLLKASTLESLGETDRAIQDYDFILKENPKDLIAVNNLAMLLTEKKGDPQSLERALALSKEFESSNPNPVFMDTLGWIYVKLGRVEDGVRVLKDAILKSPKEPSLNYHLGMAYYGSGRLKDAKVYLTKAVQSGVPFSGMKEAKNTLNQIKG